MQSLDKKIRLAIVENSFLIGGIQRLVLDQLNTLDKNKFEINLIVLAQPNHQTFYSLVPDHVKVTKLNFSGFRDLGSWLKLIKELKSFNPDVVKSSAFFSNTIARLLKPFFRYKLITAEHNTNDKKSFMQKKLDKYLNKLSYTTIVDSNMVADHFSKSQNLRKDRFTVVHNGVDIKKVEDSINKFSPNRQALREEYGVKKDEKLFLTIGRIVVQKNHLRMVEAFSLLLIRKPECKLIIIGDGGLKQQVIDKVNELNIENKVIFVGATKDIHKFYIMSDITLLSSDHEGFCIAAMEGMAFGAPLVSTRVAGVVEYLEDGKNGFFADKAPESLAVKMKQILDLSEVEFSEFQSNSRDTASSYSISNYGLKFSELILRSLNNS